ncbi:hypothetical protein AB1Y20_023228 [Prymnesium parvum]|uniref:NAD(P)H-hydrate epimerase n=1 Tax=Prymnesium parvum TaxID=97485 RepID=A0AB34JFL6_PRYPA
MHTPLHSLVRTLALSLRPRSLACASLAGPPSLKLLSQSEAIAVDQELMATPGFSVDQLMELAGLSCATAVFKSYPPTTHRRALCVCGPGNNGGDGLVAARHMAQFGYVTTVVYPKRPAQPLFVNLVEQMRMCRIPVLTSLPPQPELDSNYDVLVDAIFGFSFAGEVRAPFDEALAGLAASSLPLCSIDIPSGWDVELGPSGSAPALQPQMLVSLTMPKRCTMHFRGCHFLGGRFVPPSIAEKFGFEQPAMPGAEQVVLLHDAQPE